MADLVAVPGRLDLTIWAGNTEQVELTWPAATLDGTGPWTATATFRGGDTLDLPVTVAGDVQTITIPSATEDHLHELATWTLHDAAAGKDRVAGLFFATDHAGPSTVSADVTIDEDTVSVTVLAGDAVSSVNGETGDVSLDADDVGADPVGSASAVQANLDSHEATLPADDAGVHGRIVHDPDRDGFDRLTNIVATADGQVFTTSVVDSRLRVTSDADLSGSNQREWWLHPDTEWQEGRITGVWWGPSTFTGTNKPQIGFVFSAQRPDPISQPDQWVALVVWYNIVGASFPAGLLVDGWEIDGSDVTLAKAGGSHGGLGLVNRTGRVLHAAHVSFGGDFGGYTVAPHWSSVIPVGTPVTVAGMADSDYDVTGTVASSAAGDSTVTVELPAAPAASSDPIASGTMTPDTPHNATPYVVSAERVGNAIRVSQWAYGASSPAPGGLRTATIPVGQGNMSAYPSGPGLHGIMVGHAHSGSYAEVGQLIFERIS